MKLQGQVVLITGAKGGLGTFVRVQFLHSWLLWMSPRTVWGTIWSVVVSNEDHTSFHETWFSR